jgi:hypothetical protein
VEGLQKVPPLRRAQARSSGARNNSSAYSIGKLLDKVIERSIGEQHKYALTNLVACIPLDEGGNKTQEPSEEAIEACAPRLREFVRLCKPLIMIRVGKLATKWVDSNGAVDIIHPAAILRMDISQRGLAIQRSIVAISDAIEEL